MRFTLFVAALAVCIPAVASAQSMNAESFLQRANKLKAKGPLAIFSRDEIKVLLKEGQGAGTAARAARLADKAAGRPQRYCPPPGKASLGSDEFMARLNAIPRADRVRINMGEAMTRILIAKYPCRR